MISVKDIAQVSQENKIRLINEWSEYGVEKLINQIQANKEDGKFSAFISVFDFPFSENVEYKIVNTFKALGFDAYGSSWESGMGGFGREVVVSWYPKKWWQFWRPK